MTIRFPAIRFPAVRVAILSLGLLLAALAPSATRAEGEGSVMNWRVGMPAQNAAPSRQPQTYRARRRYDTPRLRKPQDDAELGLHLPEVAASPIARPEAGRTKIAVIGDSLADALVAGLEADPAIQADFIVRAKTVSASGLVRLDFHDWPAAMAAMAGEQKDLAAFVVLLGLNDRQAIREGDRSLEPLSEEWREAYRKRVDAVIRAAQLARVPLIWVGMPVMRAQKLSADIVRINELIKERVTAAGETCVEIYENFADDTGNFTASGPDIIGDTVRLRGPDGIHFTPAGQRKLAFFVDKPLRRRLGDRIGPKEDALLASLPQDTTLPFQPPPANLVVPPPAPATVLLPKARPDIGEIRPLIEASSATALAGREVRPLDDPATRNLFDRGFSPEPRAGRSDDFRWK